MRRRLDISSSLSLPVILVGESFFLFIHARVIHPAQAGCGAARTLCFTSVPVRFLDIYSQYREMSSSHAELVSQLPDGSITEYILKISISPVLVLRGAIAFVHRI